MLSLMLSAQVYRDQIINFEDNRLQTWWQQECPNCGEKKDISPLQQVHAVKDSHTGGMIYARISTVCMRCNQTLTETWSIN